MKRVAEVENKKDLLEKSRGWLETLDWFITSRPSESEVQEALARLAEWNPTELRGKLYRQGQWEALEWLLGR